MGTIRLGKNHGLLQNIYKKFVHAAITLRIKKFLHGSPLITAASCGITARNAQKNASKSVTLNPLCVASPSTAKTTLTSWESRPNSRPQSQAHQVPVKEQPQDFAWTQSIRFSS